MATTPEKVAALLGIGVDPLITEATETILELARAYTRGNGFDLAGDPEPDVERVVVIAAARLSANSGQVDETVGLISTRGGFVSWSLPELAVLRARRGTAA